MSEIDRSEHYLIRIVDHFINPKQANFMKKVLLLLFILPLYGKNIYALADTNNPNIDSLNKATEYKSQFFTIGYGIGIIQLKELNIMPKVQHGIQNSLLISYEKIGRWKKSLNLFVGFANLETKIEKGNDDRHESVNGMIDFNYHHSYRLLERSNLSSYLGSYIAYNYSLSSYPNWDDSHGYWGSSITWGVSEDFYIQISEKLTVETSFSLSLMGLVSRPDTYRLNKLDDGSFWKIISMTNSDYHFSIWDNSSKIHFSSGVLFPLSGNRRLGIFYNTSYSQIKGINSRPLKELLHTINIRIGL